MSDLFTAQKDVLDKGFVRLVDYMGSDEAILRAARVSTGAASKGTERDRGLIRYLYRNAHTSPFEMAELVFHIKAPIFVARQWLRHRTASVNEMSGRYRELEADFYDPSEWRGQARINHQGSEGAIDDQEACDTAYNASVALSNTAYTSLLSRGVAREQARMALPVSVYTEWYWKMDLHNLFHFLELRMDAHAQAEIRAYAEAIYEMLKGISDFEYSVEVFDQVRHIKGLLREAMNLDKELEALPSYLSAFVDARR